MRNLCKVCLTVGAAALLTSTVTAQQPQRPGGGFPGGGFGQQSGTALLRNRQVQEEIKLSEDQISKLEEVERTIREKMAEETLKALKGVLKDDQMKRFQQIELQLAAQTRGPEVFSQANVVKELKVTNEQKDKFKTLADDLQKETRQVLGGGGGGFNPEAREKLAGLRKEAMEKATSVLTADQKKTWKDMTGAAFELRRGRPDRD